MWGNVAESLIRYFRRNNVSRQLTILTNSPLTARQVTPPYLWPLVRTGFSLSFQDGEKLPSQFVLLAGPEAQRGARSRRLWWLPSGDTCHPAITAATADAGCSEPVLPGRPSSMTSMRTSDTTSVDQFQTAGGGGRRPLWVFTSLFAEDYQHPMRICERFACSQLPFAKVNSSL